MERGKSFGDKAISGCNFALSNSEPPPSFSADSLLTESVLCELKRQAPPGCVLFSFDALDEEEWD